MGMCNTDSVAGRESTLVLIQCCEILVAVCTGAVAFSSEQWTVFARILLSDLIFYVIVQIEGRNSVDCRVSPLMQH